MKSKITFYNLSNNLKKVMCVDDYTERELKIYAMLKGFEKIFIEKREYSTLNSGLKTL